MGNGSSRVRHTWTDAWLLLAIGLRPDVVPLPLAGLIQQADLIQHAVPTFEEVDGGLARLLAAGLLRGHGGAIELTSAGLELLHTVSAAQTTLHGQQRALEAALAAPPWSREYEPQQARRDPLLTPVIDYAQYAAAVGSNGSQGA